MADYRPTTGDPSTSLSIQMPQQRQRSASEAMASDDAATGQLAQDEATPQEGAALDSPSHTTTPGAESAATPSTSLDPVLMKQVEDVLSSESIISAKDFATFLKKRASLEDDHAQSLKKLCRLTLDNVRKTDHRQGTFAQGYEEMMQINERMADNGIQFAASLYQMQEELQELVGNSERTRKLWKTNGLAAEQKVVDLEQLMRKSKAKYDSLAEEYDRARTGEARPGGGKMLGAFKAHKSAAQQEEELLKKVQTADQTYHNHVNSLQYEKTQLQNSVRPEAVHALREAIAELDSGVAMQMQKFGSYQQRSLRSAVASINNEKDLNEFVAGNHTKVQQNTGEIKYERNPVLNPQQSPLPQSQPSTQSFQQPPSQNGHRAASLSVGGARAMASTFAPAGSPPSPQGAPPGSAHGLATPLSASSGISSFQQQPHGRSFSQGNLLSQSAPPPPQQYSNTLPSGSRYPLENPLPLSNTFSGQSGSQSSSPQLAMVPFQPSPPAPPPHVGGGGPPPPAYGAPGSHTPPSLGLTRPVFGVPLARLYERDGLAVPMVVYQCIQAVDLFGLGVEGIYRQSGSMSHITRLKSLFDSEPQGQSLDFRNPENFYHDVNSVTGLLKQFFRDLPDPLLTVEHHNSFINAAKHEDDVLRRDSLHAIINSLPDPNYATLRALMLHLHRVMDNSHVNRMNSHNLAVILGPTLMGTDPSTAIADAGWQIKVIDTILVNTYQIFDED
ncbi:RHO GTPase-activating protein RGD1 [Escovopsis weberi]|uniref:RHO GTPase-activating protein RGD1 n=1 Tax=Escovopsis weberi TaxID=150374 RepID=A0A0M8N209_ESCWE|nr:RHO GTPase-activating protein RGD1 [Escovopsis weberi]